MWVDISVNSDVCLAKVLKNSVWHAVKAVATRRQYWCQLDGASCHVTAPYLQFLSSKFGDRLSYRRTYHNWPPNSADLSPLDFISWAVHVFMCQTSTLEEVKLIVENLKAIMKEEDVRKIGKCREKS